MHANRRILSGEVTIQFILSTIYVAVTFRRVIEGFIRHANVPDGVFLYFINPDTTLWVIGNGVYLTNVNNLYPQHSDSL